jgi:hypothetical protein
MKKVLLTIAGTNMGVLSRAQRDEAKQASLGGVVLMTAGLAALSSSFAMHMALHAPLPAAIAVGLLWGVAIGNLDRWLITATPRQSTVMQNIRMAAPRLLLALVIGMVVSTPLTLQIFDKEIEAELTVMQLEQQAAFEERINSDPRYRDIPRQRARIAELQQFLALGGDSDAVLSHPEVKEISQKLASVEKALGRAEQAVICEREGTCGSGRVGAGPASAEKETLRDRLLDREEQLRTALVAKKAEVRAAADASLRKARLNAQTELENLTATVQRNQAARDAESANNSAAVNDGDGLLARLKALHRIGEDDATLLAAHIALFVFFTSIECLPILVKLMLALGKPSLYEQLMALADEEQYEKARLEAHSARRTRELETESALDSLESRLRSQAQAETEAARMISEAQRDLAEQAIADWKARQRQLIDEDLEAFVWTADRDMHLRDGGSEAGAATSTSPSPGATHEKFAASI